MARIKLSWTPEAQNDVRQVERYIARNAPKTAKTFTRRLMAAVRRLRRLPESGWVVEEIGDPRIREIVYGAFRIIYRFADYNIHVLAVRRGARLLDPEEFQD